MAILILAKTEGTGVAVPWDLTLGVTHESELALSGINNQPVDIDFSPDGTRMYVLSNINDRLTMYNLSSAWDITSATESTNKILNAQDSQPAGFAWRTDGSRMYMCGSTGNLFQYSISFPPSYWNPTALSYDSVFYDASPYLDITNDIFWKPDGTQLYVMGVKFGSIRIYQTSVFPAWDLSGANSTMVNPVGLPVGSNHFSISSDGTKLYVSNSTNAEINQYSIGTPWDFSTVSGPPVPADIEVTGRGSGFVAQGIAFKSDGLKVYTVDNGNHYVDQYTIP